MHYNAQIIVNSLMKHLNFTMIIIINRFLSELVIHPTGLCFIKLMELDRKGRNQVNFSLLHLNLISNA